MQQNKLQKQFSAMIKYAHILNLLLVWLWANNTDFIDEELQYTAGFRFMPAGEASLFLTTDSLNGESVYKLTTSIKTNSFLDVFYKVRDDIQSWLNPENFSLKKTIQQIREGRYHRDHQSIIQGDSIAISENQSQAIPGKVYDPVSFIYYLRKQDLNLGNSYKFYSYNRKKIREVIVNITAKETVQVSAGTFNCLKVEPVAADGIPLLKNDGQMRVWITDDHLRLPVKIEQNTNIGTMVMKLKAIK